MNLNLPLFIDHWPAKVDIAFVLDASKSLGVDNYEKMKGFVKRLLDGADIDNGDVRVGIVSYSTKANVEFMLNSYNTKADVFDAVNSISWKCGSINTADGLRAMREEIFSEDNGDRHGVPNICILITDGVSNINSRRTIPEAEYAKASGIHIFAIGIGLKDQREINEMASKPASTNAFAVRTFDELEDLDEKVLLR